MLYQHEMLLGFMTVREHLIFHANVRMPPGTPRQEIHRRVNEVSCVTSSFESLAVG